MICWAEIATISNPTAELSSFSVWHIDAVGDDADSDDGDNCDFVVHQEIISDPRGRGSNSSRSA